MWITKVVDFRLECKPKLKSKLKLARKKNEPTAFIGHVNTLATDNHRSEQTNGNPFIQSLIRSVVAVI